MTAIDEKLIVGKRYYYSDGIIEYIGVFNGTHMTVEKANTVVLGYSQPIFDENTLVPIKDCDIIIPYEEYQI